MSFFVLFILCLFVFNLNLTLMSIFSTFTSRFFGFTGTQSVSSVASAESS